MLFYVLFYALIKEGLKLSRLPTPGGDTDIWGQILNDFLSVEHTIDGVLKLRTDGTLDRFYSKPVGGIPDTDLSPSIQSALAVAGQAVRIGGDLSGSGGQPAVVATHLSAPLPVSQGGTGSMTQNFVDLGSNQRIGGVKSFAAIPTVPGGSVMPLDWVNVMTFGAKGDGITDDTLAIQLALGAVPQGGIVYMPAATYAVSAPLIVPPCVTLLGAHATHLDNTTAVIKPSSLFTGIAVIEFVDQATGGYATVSHEQRVCALAIDGSNLPPGNTVDGIRGIGFVHGVMLEDVSVRNVGGHGFATAINGSGGPYSWRGTRLVANTTGSYGFSLAMTDCTWIDLESIGAGKAGFFVSSGANTHFIGCRSEWSAWDGLQVTGSLSSGTGSGGMTFTDFSTDRNGYNGIFVNATGTVPIYFNGLMLRRDGRNGGIGGGAYAGICVSSATVPVIIDGVTVFPGVDDNGASTLSPERGITVSNSTYTVVYGGWVHAATTPIHDGNGNTVFRVNPNIGTATGPTATPTYSYDNPWGTDNGSTLTIGLNAADQQGLVIANVAGQGQPNNPLINLSTGSSAYDNVVKTSVVGESHARFSMYSGGQLNWGGGTLLSDTNLYRSAAATLKTDQSLVVGTALGVGQSPSATGLGVLTATNATTATFTTTLASGSGNTSATVQALVADVGNKAYATSISGESNGRFVIYGDGTATWGSGSASRDVQLQRTATATLTLSPLNGASSGSLMLSSSNMTIHSTSTQVGLTVQGGATQSVNLTEWRSGSNGSLLSAVDNGGNITSPGITVKSALVFQSGAANGAVLTSDAQGNASWQIPATNTPATNASLGVIELSGDLGGTATVPYVTATHLSSALPVAQGGTGSTTQNFVDLSTIQTIAGAKTFSSALAAVAGLSVTGTGMISSNLAVGTTTGSFGGGSGVVNVANATTVPTAAPTGGGVLYANAGLPYWVDTTGRTYNMGMPSIVLPEDHNLIGWSFDPALISGGSAPTNGVVQLVKVILRVTRTVNNIICYLHTPAASGLTANENFAGLYTASGTLLSATADQSTNWTGTQVTKTMALTTPQSNLVAGIYYVALLANGTTAPTFGRASNVASNVINIGLGTSSTRFATSGTSQTSLPSSISMSGVSQANQAYWVALS